MFTTSRPAAGQTVGDPVTAIAAECRSSAETVSRSISGLCDAVAGFADEALAIASRWRECSGMLNKQTQLLELMDIPQVMDTCLRSQSYDEALRLCLHVDSAHRLNPDIGLLKGLHEETQRLKKLMTEQLVRELRANRQLPDSLKIVSLIRKLRVFSETEIRIKFLTSRDSWLESLISDIPVTPAILHLTKFIDICRVNLFDTVTQYRAIFPSTGMRGTAAVHVDRDGDQDYEEDAGDDGDDCDFTDSKILTSWLLVRLESALQQMNKDLVACLESDPSYPIDSISDACFFFGQSMARIGADIRPRILLIFTNIRSRRSRREPQLMPVRDDIALQK